MWGGLDGRARGCSLVNSDRPDPVDIKESAGVFPFRRSSFDWLIAVFVATAWVGYWAAYDQTTAWSKFWLIVASVLLYYSLAAQPKENLVWISGVFFCLGVGVSIYFFLTHDFVSLPRKLKLVNELGRWLMQNRPPLMWTPIHPNYVAGIVAITTPFVFYPVWKLKNNIKSFVVLLYGLVAVGLGLSFFALVMATSRGVVMAIASALGVWLLWRIVHSGRINLRLVREAVFPSLILLYLIAVFVLLYIGPAKLGSSVSGQNYFDTESRAQLFSRSVYFLTDFPFTGGGLGSFPGLFSQYVLDIPFYSLPNSHNLFLDVFIEQGLFGGLAYLLIYIASIWVTAWSIVKAQSTEMQVVGWLSLFALVIACVHGLVDDYLYYQNGAILSLFLAGVASNTSGLNTQVDQKNSKPLFKSMMIFPSAIAILIFGMLLLNLNKIRSDWYANIGAVEMAKVELRGFPENEWAGTKHVSDLTTVEDPLLASLQLDPHNQTANYRLGLISLAQQDYPAACDYLLEAYQQSPRHRGIVKSLGYCYVWLDDMDHAQLLLKNISEAKSELETYAWWWKTQGRSDLSTNANAMNSALETLSPQH